MNTEDSIFSLLQQEGYLVRSCLYTGFLALNKANLSNKGDFYVAFFQLSIGLERLLKLVLILDYMAVHQLATPDNTTLSKYKHKIRDMLNDISEIEKRVSNKTLIGDILKPGSLEHAILVFLDEFAQRTRYANLDILTGKDTIDPLEQWNKITMRIVSRDVPKELKKNLIEHSIAINQAMRPHAKIVFDDLEKNPPTLEQAWWLGSMFKMVAPYVIWRIMKIIYPIFRVMDDVSNLTQKINISAYSNQMIVPVMHEFLYDFVSDDKEYVMNVEQWLKND